MQQKSFIRITAWVALVATVFMMLFSTIFITEHIDHDCTGEDCPICAVMIQCVSNLKSLGTIVVTCTFIVLFLRIICDGQSVSSVRAFNSPVSQKVRMNN